MQLRQLEVRESMLRIRIILIALAILVPMSARAGAYEDFAKVETAFQNVKSFMSPCDTPQHEKHSAAVPAACRQDAGATEIFRAG